jgi:anti-anti-sigma factor
MSLGNRPNIATRETDLANVLVVTGRLCQGAKACDALREEVKVLLSRADKKGLVINLQNVTYLDSVGVGVMVEAAQGARQYGVGFKVVINPPPPLVTLTRVFEFFYTEAEALASFK